VKNLNKLTENELLKFDTITEAYTKLVECKNTLNQLAQKVESDFKSQEYIDKGYYFSNPIPTDYEIERIANSTKSNIIDFIILYIDKKFKNLVIDEHDVREFISMGEANQKLQFDLDQPEFSNARPIMQGQFTARKVIQYIEDKYADEETITLQQLKELAKNALPWIGEYNRDRASKPEHIPVINKTGISLNSDTYNHYKSNTPAAIIKLIHIKLNHELPSQAEHHDIDYEDVYSDDKIKSLRKYKNGKLKIIFNTVEDMETVRRMLVGGENEDEC